MLIFEAVRYKNFLASGNHFIEIPLDRYNVTVITGNNGSGKSTISDALCFCLFNKGFRNVPKGNFVNSVNGKDTVVEVEFSNNSKKYLVRRGIKPSIFEIEVDGEKIDEESNVRDQQKYLETQLLGMNWKTFTQIVILGSASHVPFMQLEAADRRLIIEDLLDLQIFSKMRKVLKDKTDDAKFALLELNGEISTLASKIDLQRKFLERSKTESSDRIEKNKKIIEETNGLIAEEVERLKEDQNAVGSYDIEDIKKRKSEEEDSKSKYDKIISKLEVRIQQLKDEIKFFESHSTCPTCKGEIDEQFKESAIQKNSDIVVECEEGVVKAEGILETIREKLSNISADFEKISKLNVQVTAHKNTIISHEKFIEKIQSDIDEHLKENTDAETAVELEESVKQLEGKKEEKIILEETKEVQSLATTLLKDTGIKSNIIKKFVPVINHTVNKYLNMMDFFIKFELDENFKESIRSRHIDDYRYANFSEGERRRIDLAILMTWIEVASRKNSLNCNLLILDELFDGALDAEGIDSFSKIIKAQFSKNIFIITHKMELIDKLESEKNAHINFEKHKGFSCKSK
jgi:DNA repair exonuclease SbcCD ATPase subunit